MQWGASLKWAFILFMEEEPSCLSNFSKASPFHKCHHTDCDFVLEGTSSSHSTKGPLLWQLPKKSRFFSTYPSFNKMLGWLTEHSFIITKGIQLRTCLREMHQAKSLRAVFSRLPSPPGTHCPPSIAIGHNGYRMANQKTLSKPLVSRIIIWTRYYSGAFLFFLNSILDPC